MDQEKKTEGLGGQQKEQNFTASEFIPDVKRNLNHLAQTYCDMAHDLNILHDMLPTKMTNVQTKALHRILCSIPNPR